MTKFHRGAIVASVVFVASASLLTGCASGIPTSSTSILASDEILTAQLDSEVSARGVVLAAVLLVAGDVEAALDTGLVTSAEVNTAQTAIDEGTVDLWRQRAEMDTP